MKEKEKEIILNKSLKRKAKMHISLVKKVVYNPKKVVYVQYYILS